MKRFKLEKEQKQNLIRLSLSLVLFIIAIILPLKGAARLISILIPFIIIGYDILYSAFSNILHGQWLDEKFLMSLASIGAFVINQYNEAFAVMFFYQLGEFFEDAAVGKSRKSIEDLLNIVPEEAVRLEGDREETISLEEVNIGDTLLVKPGERVPVDGTVISGFSALDVAALTGESVPQNIGPENKIYSGSINLSGSLIIKADSLYKDSTVSRIMDLIENSFEKKARSEKFITRFSKYYTPVVVFMAIALCVLPPLFTGDPFSKWLERALIFLVASCPCALLVSVPLSFMGGLGSASKNGILIKSAGDLEALSKADTFVFDKTGTITKGSFEVAGVHTASEQPANEQNKSYMLDVSAALESHSAHPIAVSIKNAHKKEIDMSRLSNVKELAGKGVSGDVDGENYSLGNAALMQDIGSGYRECSSPGTIVHLSKSKEYLGHILISDSIKPDAKEAIQGLKDLNIKRCIMLSGDRENVVKSVADETGIKEYYAELMPEDKVRRVEQLISQGRKTAFVGDGINDAPVLMRADVGIAMGALGSDAAIESADIVLMDDKLIKLPKALKISMKTMDIVRQNIFLSLAIKFIVLVLGALGKAPIWAAVFADVGVMILAVLNSLRAMYIK